MGGNTVKVLQITDTHLFSGNGGRLLGLDTEQSLAAVLEDVRQNRMPADLVLATGDLVHDGSEAAYRRFFTHMNSLDLPVYCLPGNHDEAARLLGMDDTGHCRYLPTVIQDGWHIVLLDSTIPGDEGGHLSAATLTHLDQLLTGRPDHHTLICLHHQPVPMGSDWLDTMAIRNPQEFFDILDQHPQVRGVLWGHVHQEFDGRHGPIRLMSTPSTCIQFKPGSSSFALDHAAPGYRWLELHPDGNIDTGIRRTDYVADSIDFAANGY